MENISKTSLISVVGKGQIEIVANILELRITAYNVSESLKKAQNEVNKIVNEILNILKKYKINKKDIHTTSLEFEPNYTWKNNSKVYTGQRVEQNLVCIIDNIINNSEKVVNILDNITIDNNSIVLSLQFGVKENKDMILRCRELAYEDGYEKARRYAELAGLKIVKALKISENEIGSSYSRYDVDYACESPSFQTQMPMGSVKKSMTLYMEFIAE